MKNTEIKNAVIESAKLSFAERGILDCWLYLKYGDGISQGFGGYSLYLPKSFTHYKMNSPAGHFIYRVMEVAGVEDWSKLAGRSIRVQGDFTLGGTITAIGHIINEDWFCPSEDFAVKDK